MIDMNQLSTDDLQTIAFATRRSITALELKGSYRTVSDAEKLKHLRDIMRRCRRALKQRIRQLPLL